MNDINNMTEEEVNSEYDKLMKALDIKENETLPEATPVTIDTSNGTFETNQTENSSSIVMGVQDQATGNIASTTEVSMEDIKNLSDKNFEFFTKDKSDTTIDSNKVINILDPETAKNLKDVETVANMIQRRSKGEQFSAYNLFPDSIKDQVKLACFQKGLGDQQSINSMANAVLDEMVKSYSNLNDGVVDLETMLSGFSPEVEKMVADNAKEVGSYMMTLDDQRKKEIDAAIERCKAEGKEDSIDKLNRMKDAIDDAYNLDKFAEAVKTIKIKKFDLEKPSRVYESFVYMYNKSNNNINDIRICPTILNRHLMDVSEEDNLRVCLAFCKYTRSMSPDNIEDHTFMYYFIRNIIMLDRINPKAKIYDSLEGPSKLFYDEFTSNLRKVINNLKK